MSKLPRTIAIDGPAASGKSTVAKRLADDLNYVYFDTGVMYRAVTWVALDRHIEIENETDVTALAQIVQIDVRLASKDDGRDSDVLADGDDITWKIRRPEVDANVSVVSAYAGVRQALLMQQRRVGERGVVVMVGRDIGTVVLPNADLKIYLDASVEERANRRYEEALARGDDVTLESILAAMRKRDEIDSTREFAPLRAAKDAILVDSDNMTIDEVFKYIKDHVEKI
ncbi:MAG: (d)CMP kinase [Chloroflexi bacterium]|nr:(d)CMP kinase [Chloroflexota bacterium]